MKGQIMKKRHEYLSASILILAFFLGLAGHSASADGNRNRNSKYYPMADLRPVEFKGQILGINQSDKYIIVDQGLINVVSNMVLKDGTTFTTDCVDEKGHSIPFSSFMSYQRVNVTGYRASDRYTFAVKIQRQPLLPKDKRGPLSD